MRSQSIVLLTVWVIAVAAYPSQPEYEPVSSEVTARNAPIVESEPVILQRRDSDISELHDEVETIKKHGRETYSTEHKVFEQFLDRMKRKHGGRLNLSSPELAVDNKYTAALNKFHEASMIEPTSWSDEKLLRNAITRGNSLMEAGKTAFKEAQEMDTKLH